jgi:superfamily II DNA helicase RecQ
MLKWSYKFAQVTIFRPNTTVFLALSLLFTTNKEHVLQDFTKTDSKLRTVFATVAFGMGVDVPDIDFVVHWGAPRGLEQFAQESGRAGRDGRHSTSIIYYTCRDIAKDRSSNEMREFCKSSTCLRAIMNL